MEEEKEKMEEELEEEGELKDTLEPGVKTYSLPEFRNASKFRFVDCTAELFREYIYSNGSKLHIDDPIRLSIAQNNAHRVFDVHEFCYYIPPNWIAIVWKPRPGAPHFIM